MTTTTVVTHSAEETIAQGRALAKSLHAPALVLLAGELGAGKTTFTKGLVGGLGAAQEEEVTSPTFALVHEYPSRFPVFHIDLYRVSSFHDLESAGIEDAFSKPGVVIVEWPERLTLRTEWPQVRVELAYVSPTSRRITIERRDQP